MTATDEPIVEALAPEDCECDPCVPWGLCAGCCDGWDELDEGLRCRATSLAWATLRTLTAGRVGSCAVTMRPCLSAPCDACSSSVWMRPHIRDGNWINTVCPQPRCSCVRMCEIAFPGPVAKILEVSWSGGALPLDSFRIDNGNLLVRTDGECWPSCQRMDRPLGASCTLGVTYVPGVAPGPEGQWAAGVLACEFAKACQGGKCRLPTSVVAIARQGVSMELATGMFADGQTGIREVDAFILSLNPNRLRNAPMVWSPDLPAHRWTT